jgi:hypothetical protein
VHPACRPAGGPRSAPSRPRSPPPAGPASPADGSPHVRGSGGCSQHRSWRAKYSKSVDFYSVVY